jgi:hypothetical protein
LSYSDKVKHISIGGYLLRYIIVMGGIKIPLSGQGVVIPIPGKKDLIPSLRWKGDLVVTERYPFEGINESAKRIQKDRRIGGSIEKRKELFS